MSKLRKLLIVMLGICMAVCLCLSVAACDTSPAVRNPGNNSGQTDTTTDNDGKYVIDVKSAGGIPLSGVEINVKKNGSIFKTLISVKGQVSFELEPDVYDLEVNESTLPEGYYIPEGTYFRTSADENRYEIAIPSKVISTTATSGTVYKLGDVMHDFVATEAGGDTQYKLSEILETKKAVMINCWGISCVPCQMEFPAIQKAYEAYSEKLEIVALSSYGSDTEEAIAKFKQTNNYTFPMALDKTGIYNLFGVSAWPTSIIIDRYGVVAYISSGTETSESIWKALFNNYTSDSYVQTAPDETTDEGEEPEEWTKPTGGILMPSSAEIAAAINGKGTENKIGDYYPETNEVDKEYTWPWILAEDSEGKYITASNSKVKYSYSIIYVDVTLEAGDSLSYEYNVDTESGGDVLYVFINDTLINEHSGDSDGWQTELKVYTASYETTIQLAFCYMKNNSLDVGSDTASIRNITVLNILDDDLKLSVINKAELVAGKYNVQLELDEAQNYYYVTYTDEDGESRRSLLLADILNPTLWSDKHIGASNFVNPENSKVTASLYMISYWQMSNYLLASLQGLIFTYGYSDTIIANFYMQQDVADYGLVPVTPELKAALEAFTKEFYAKGLNTVEGDSWYEDQWLELCYYYRHYGFDHEDRECYETMDPIKGYLPEFAYSIGEGTVSVDVDKATMYNGGGIWYKFVPEKTGVYLVYTSPKDGSAESDPTIRIYGPNDVISLENDNKITAAGNDDLSYDCLDNPNIDHVKLYVELVAGQEYIIQANLYGKGMTGSFDMTIEYAGEYVEFLRICSTAYGSYTTELDDYGNMDVEKLIYLAIPVTISPDDNLYHAVVNNDYGSRIYVDFIHPNCFDISNHTPLIDIINHGGFNFTSIGGEDYTDVMLDYYQQSIEGKDKDDVLYGMLEASQELVNTLNLIIGAYDKNPETTAWLSFACYFEYYGTPAEN